MSDLTDRIAAEHVPLAVGTQPGLCSCGASPDNPNEYISSWRARHMAEVTEAAVREQVAQDIEYAESMSRASLIERPKIGPGEFLNDWQWAARIARGGA